MKSRKINFQTIKSNILHIVGETPTGHEIIKGLLSTVYKMDANAIAEILTADAKPEEVLSKIVEADKSRVKDLNDKIGKDKYQEGYSNGQKFALTNKEKEIKEHYGIESDKIGTDLFDEIIAKKSGEAGAKSEEEIKRTPTYQMLESKSKKELGETQRQYEDRIKKMEDGYKKETAFATVGKSAIDILNGLNPVLPKNPTVKSTQERDFLNELKGYDYEQQGDKILVMKDGKLLQDEHGHTMDYSEHVKRIASNRFEFAANNGGGNGGNGRDNGNGGNAGSGNGGNGGEGYPKGITKPKTIAELNAIMSNRDIPAKDRRIVGETYRKENAG